MKHLLEIKDLCKNFGGLKAVDKINFSVDEGEIVGLIGPNGSGKTTIFNLINSYYTPTSGSILFKGHNITRLPTHKIAKMGIGRTFQVVKPLKRLTVKENVIAGAFVRESSFSKASQAATDALKFCRLDGESDIKAGKLPIAGRKRLEIAKALATRPRLLLLDETAAGLNPTELNTAIEIIKKIRSELGITIIIVEHIMKVIMTISDRIHAIARGATIATGSPAHVSKDPTVIEAYLGTDANEENADRA